MAQFVLDFKTMRESWFCGMCRILILLLNVQVAVGVIIPQGRTPNTNAAPWQYCGVEGGIPSVTNIFARLTVTNTLTDINNAIAACPSNRVVLLGAGTYNLSGQIIFNGKNGVVLRGAGTNTVLNFSGSSPYDALVYICGANDRVYTAISSGSFDGATSWTAGYSQGASNLTVASSAGLAVGQIVCLDQANDNFNVMSSSFEGCTYCGRNNGLYSQEEWKRVVAISGNLVTVWPPVMMPNWNTYGTNNPTMWWVNGISQKNGIENFSINGANTTPGGVYGGNIMLDGCANCWVSNVCSYVPYIQHVMVYGGYRNEVRHCYFYGTQNAASLSYGILPEFTSCDLFIDNIFNAVTSPVMFGSASSGCVTAYNYTTNNLYYTAGWLMASFETHDAHVCMNLFEGNFGTQFNADFIHGSGGYNTVFRNRLTATEVGKNNNLFAVNVSLTNRYLSFVGNLLGSAGVNTVYGEFPGNGVDVANAIYLIGVNNTGYPQAWGPDPLTYSTAYLHGNYDVVSSGIIWDPSNADHAIPPSLFLNSKPAFFGNLNWPPYDPASTSVAFLDGTNIPAGFRFVFGVDPGGVQPPVAVASATPTNGPMPLAVTFSSAGSYDPGGGTLTYSWAFGDGRTSTAANPSHSYTNAGTYNAQLTVSDGTNSAFSAPIRIVATTPGSNEPPVVVVGGGPTTGAAPLTVAFSSAGSYDPEGATLTYNWAFGDGGTSTTANPSYTYVVAGTFNATLQVSDGTNITSSSPLTITVTNPPPVVVLTSPTNGASYAAPATINLVASVTPNGHTITKVQFYSGGVALLAEDTTAPYTLTWTNVGAGTYSLTARVFYDAGATTDSAAVTVGVGGLVAGYGFEEGSGATTADGSGNGNTGTISGAAWTSTGEYGNALSFNGTSSLVTVNDSPSLDLTSSLTLEAWVYPTALGGWRSILFKPQGTTGLCYVLQGSSGATSVPSLGLSVAASNLMGPNPLPLNAWSHLAATYDGATMVLYVNGVQVASQAQTGAVSTSADALTIGGDAAGEDWAGTIDEVRIYSRALSAAEIQTDMNTPVRTRPAPPTGLHRVPP